MSGIPVRSRAVWVGLCERINILRSEDWTPYLQGYNLDDDGWHQEWLVQTVVVFYKYYSCTSYLPCGQYPSMNLILHLIKIPLHHEKVYSWFSFGWTSKITTVAHTRQCAACYKKFTWFLFFGSHSIHKHVIVCIIINCEYFESKIFHVIIFAINIFWTNDPVLHYR